MNVFHKLLSRTAGVLAAFLLLSVGVAQAQWMEVASFSGDRWGAAGEYYNGKIYVFGGVTNGQLSTETKILDVAGGASSWTDGAAMSGTRYYHTSGIANNKIYLFGGLINGSTFSQAVTSFDPATGQFASAGTLPRASWQAASASVGSKVYIMGGITVSGQQAVFTQSMLVYDASTGGVSELPTGAPYAGYNQAATAIGNTIYVVGGEGNGGLTNAFKGTVDGSGNVSWSPIANLPTVISRGAAGSLNGKLIVAGGVSTTPGFREAYVYDEGTNSWSPYYLTPSTAIYPVMTGDGQTPYLIGGSGNTMTWKGTEGAPVAVAYYNQDAIFATLQPGGQTTQGVSITSGGLVGLQVNATIPGDAQGWLSANSQTIARGLTVNYNFSINASSLSPGKYHTTATLETNDPASPTHEVDVYLYVGDPGVNQETRVVFEEGSGDWCQYCPDGHRKLKEVEDQFGDKVIILSYHGGGDLQDPLMINEGSQIVSALGLPGWPSGSINRLLFSGETAPMVNRGSWKTYVAQVLENQPTAQANLEVEDYKFDPDTREITAKVSVTPAVWTAPQSLRLNVVVTQEGIFTTQTEFTGSTVIEHPSYEQPHSVRYVWPNAVGSPFVPDAGQLFAGYMPPGVTVTQEVRFTLPERSGVGNLEIKPEDAEIAFFAHVNNGSSFGPILQGYQRELEGGSVSGPSIAVDWGTTSKDFMTGESGTYSFTVTNNRSEPAQITINRAAENLPNGWTSEICTDQNECDNVGNVVYTIPGDGTHTFYLKINSVGSEVGETGSVRLIVQGPNDFIADQTYNASTRTSSVAVPGESAGLSMTSITPNPASSVARIDVTIPSGAQTSLEIYTIGGEKVATLFDGRLEAGRRQIDADVSNLESGKYILVLTSGDKKVSRTMTIVR